jgi:hypothetical protein
VANVTKYLLLYRSSVAAGEQMGASPEQAQEGMELWMQWAGKASGALVDLGSPLAAVATVGNGDGGQPIGGFSILEAESVEAVKELLDGHPHFHSPGDPSIEILEFLPIPGM